MAKKYGKLKHKLPSMMHISKYKWEKPTKYMKDTFFSIMFEKHFKQFN